MNQMLIEKLKDKSVPLLITGFSGSGKTFTAKSIHEQSSRAQEPFIVMNLATIKDDLLESELFGFVKGAFTGATENKVGYAQAAGAGTLFLDEVGELSLGAQKKLLRLIDEGVFNQVGSSREIIFKGRVIAATNKKLWEMVQNNLFREDLFYRLKTFHITLNPIAYSNRERMMILNEMIKKIVSKHGTRTPHLSSELINFLANEGWSGNLREQKNNLELILLTHDEQQDISLDEYLNFMKSQQIPSQKEFIKYRGSYQEALESFEKELFREKLTQNNGRVCQTARDLEISKTTLIQKARKYGINTLKLRAESDSRAA